MNYELNDTKENIIKLLETNDIDRNKYLLKFLKIMKNNSSHQIFSLNGKWGSGKTIFIKKLVTLIRYCSMYNQGKIIRENVYSQDEIFNEADISNMENILKNSPSYREFNEIVKVDLINCIYFNAWEHDDEDDPILSILYTLIKKYNLQDKTTKIDSGTITDKINFIIKTISMGKIDSSDILRVEDLSTSIRRKESLKEAIDTTINNLISENCNKLIIFIDELDRCNPSYAIRLLERIKHYFTDERLIIVISTNLVELSNAISAIYGNKFSSSAYLDKFFDARLELPKANKNTYIEMLNNIFKFQGGSWFSTTISSFIKYSNMELREINRYLGTLSFFEKRLTNSQDMIERYINLINVLFIPYAIGLYITDVNKYTEFKDKRGWSDLEKFIRHDEKLIKLCKYMIYSNKDATTPETLEEVKKLYGLMFDEDYRDKVPETVIGGNRIYGDVFNYLEDKMSLLGSLSDFGERN